MAAIERGSGTTPSERYLAEIADRTFLNLWSYPNLFVDRKTGSKGDGKELCDLLVVCGDDVLIFSDKSIAWPPGKDFGTRWGRWYRSAIEKSVAQIGGAERWLNNFPDRIFLDKGCTQKFPIELPPAERRRVHGIIVALGAREPCAEHYENAIATFPIAPALKGSEHLDTAAPGFVHFGIGDVRPDGSFVHVFDDRALTLVMSELDTLIDFTEYLTSRERVIRSGRLMPVTGEEELLACYMISEGPNGTHDFVKPDGGEWQEGDKLVIPPGTFAGLAQYPGYAAKKKADNISYIWDQLIRQFTDAIVGGTSVAIFGRVPNTVDAERGLRILALEPRVQRRLLGGGVVDAIRKAEEKKTERFVRMLVPGPHSADRTVVYVILILAYPKHELKGGYDQYRIVRTGILRAYCLYALHENPNLKTAVGLGFDASPKVTGRLGGSEDLVAFEVDEWTPALEEELKEYREKLDMMDPARVVRSVAATDEYPAVPSRP